MPQPPVTIRRHLPEKMPAAAVEVFDAAFGEKLSLAIPSAQERQVIDTDPRAQELYARHGHVVVKNERFGFLRRFLGLGAVYTMDLFLEVAEVERD